MAAAFVVETERWKQASVLFPASDIQVAAGQSAGNGQAMQAVQGPHGGHGGVTQPAPGDAPTVRSSNRSQTLPLFTRGLAEAFGGSADVDKSLAGLKATASDVTTPNPMLEVRQLEINALAASMKQDHIKATELMKKAVGLEEALGAPSGPPMLIKPAHELFGEILLRAGKPAEAGEQFRIALRRQPNRARSLLGAARAAAQSGDQPGASSLYAKLLEQWKQADEGLPELREARENLRQAKP